MKTDKGKSIDTALVDGKIVRVGDQLPLPERKLKIRPASWIDDPAKSPKGAFRSKA